jgi:hypothetical protein
MGGREGCGISANEDSCAHGAQINFIYLTPYLTDSVEDSEYGKWFTASTTGRKNLEMKKESGAKSLTCMTNGPSYKNYVLDFLGNKRVENINRNGNLTRGG